MKLLLRLLKAPPLASSQLNCGNFNGIPLIVIPQTEFRFHFRLHTALTGFRRPCNLLV